MATLEQLAEGIKRAHAAGNEKDVQTLGAAYRAMQSATEQRIEEDPMRQGAARADGGGNPFASIWNGITDAVKTEGQNTDWSNPLQAGSDFVSSAATRGINAIPIAGPKLLEGAERAKAFVQGRPYEDVATTDEAQAQKHPVASAVGSTVGTVAPFMAGGAIPFGARALGLTGSLGSRVLFGGGTSGAIETVDSLARGDNLGDALLHGGEAALVGGGFPIVGHGLGELWRLVTGKSASKEAQNVARAMRDDEVPLDQIQQRGAELGPDAMLMDLGPNLQAQAGAVASVPGPGQKVVRDAVTARAKGASQRVEQDVGATVGHGPDITTLGNQITAGQKAAADPIYTSIRNIPLSNLPQLAAVAKTPMGQKALHDALDMMANDGIKLANGQFTVGLADYMKRALDDVATSASRAGNNNVARQASNMTKAITGAVDKVVPAYKQARDAFAGPAKVLDALDQGTQAFSKDMSPSQLNSLMGGMSQSERQAFLHGAQSQIEALMGNAVNDVATLRNTFRKGWNEAKLRILLGNNVADDLLKRIERELAYGKTAGAVSSNSETARRLASQGEVNPTTGTIGAPGKTITGLIFDAFNGVRNALSGVRQPQINRGMATLHTTKVTDLTPAQLRALQNGSAVSRPGIIAPAAPALGQDRLRNQYAIPGG